MDDQNKNLILATALSFIVILVWFVLFPPADPVPPPETPITTELSQPGTVGGVAMPAAVATGTASVATAQETRDAALADTPRVAIDTPRLGGSMALLGGRVDDLLLKDYRTSLDPGADQVTMLSPAGTPNAYYALYGWAPGAGLSFEAVPGANTLWQLESGDTLRPGSPVTLVWDNDAGLVFRRTVEVDADYMFTIRQSVQNTSAGTVSLAPYGLLARHGEPVELKNFFILHEGLIGMADGELTETDYDDATDFPVVQSEGAQAEVTQVSENGWLGFTDHYWMSTLIPAPGSPFKSAVKYDARRDIYQAEAVLPVQTLAEGQSYDVQTQLYAGAKEWEAIRSYEKTGIAGFIDSIDWGWFFFLTKPIFWLLHELNKMIGNMGWSIIGLTLIIKAILFPLAYKSYVSMAKMKELQPQMEKLKEAVGDDRQKLQQGMMELYKKERVNPAAGCLPILLQIPIFFSLYKVIFVTIELRHAPFFGPFQDLSAPDPTSIYNLYGLLPWGTPAPDTLMALVFIGILPLMLGISMWLQQKLNPAPTDPTQKLIFAWMPWVFMFMLGGFASGLVVYWIANNMITFTQQYLIMRSQGYTPDVFGNIKGSLRRGSDSTKK